MPEKGEKTENSENNYPLINEILSLPRPNHQEAEDITQEAILRCLAKEKPSFEYEGQRKHFAWTVVNHLWIDFFRLQNHRPVSLDNDLPGMELSPEYQVTKTESDENLRIAIYTELTLNEQIVILGHYYGGLSFVEIAQILEVSTCTVYRIHLRALKKLRNIIEEDE